MVAFDRSKFKKADLKEVEKTVKQAESTMFSRGGEWVSFFTPDEGRNIVRVLPALKGSPYVPLKTSKLECEVNTYDKDGNVTGKEIKEKNIFCADIHGSDILKGKDPIVAYCRYVRLLAEDIQDKDERDRFLSPLTGYKTKKGWVWGIEPILNYICYVTPDYKEILKLQLRSQWMKTMKNLSIEQSEEDTLSLDIFSDPDNGYPLCINKGQDEKTKKQVFSLTAVLPKKTQNWDDFFAENTVPDELLQKLAGMASLEETYVNVYRKKDWEMALDGLQRFDEAQGYNVFQMDEFLCELEEMAALVPSDDKEEKPAVEEKRQPTQRPAVQRPEATETARKVASYPPLIELKSFLRDYVNEVYGEDQEIPNTLSVMELRDWYDLAKADKELPFDAYENDNNGLPFSEEKPAVEEKQVIDTSVASEEDAKLSEARNRLAGLRRNK